MRAEDYIPQSRETRSLTPEELRRVDDDRRDTFGNTSVRVFVANLDALRSDIVDVEVEGKSQRYYASERIGVNRDPVTGKAIRTDPDQPADLGYFWTGSTSPGAKGRPTARFSWGGQTLPGLMGQFVVDGTLYSIRTSGRFQILTVSRQPYSALPGTEPRYTCIDSTGATASDTKPDPRCDRPQSLGDGTEPPIPPNLTQAEAESYKRLHKKLRMSPLRCRPHEITYCEDMVRISCNADADHPVYYYDNASAELLGTCGFWVRNPNCMPQRWKACTAKNSVQHIAEEPDPSQ